MDDKALLGWLLLAVLLAAPLVIGLAAWARSRRDPGGGERPSLRFGALSALTYVLAFNLTFFIQELFLVVPKALTPGLRPTLYHNNHNWEGSHPLESLFQGTGAAAILVSGLVFAALARRDAGRSEAMRLFVLWMAYCGLFQSLPQFATAAISPGSDTGQALDFFGLPVAGEWLVSFAGAASIVAAGVFMSRRFVALMRNPGGRRDGRRRSAFVVRAALLPAVAAIPLIIAYRVPREWIEVALPPVAVAIVGLVWVQAFAWRSADVGAAPPPERSSLLWPAVLALLLLLAFQLVLRPGIAFY